MEEQPSPEKIMEVGLGFWASKTLMSAIEMELFTELARQPENLETVPDRLGLYPRYLASVEPIFEEYVDANGLSGRLSFTAGDFFEDDLPSVDVVVMGHILHDWSLEEKRLLIRKAFDAVPEGFDYTGAECMEWMREAGFSDTRVEHLAGPDSMFVGEK